MKDTFIIRTEWWPAISKLNDTQKAKILTNLFNFHSDGEVDLSDPLIELVWSFIEPNLMRNIANYDKRVKIAAENGSKGGRPKANGNLNNQVGFLASDKKPIETLNDSVSVSVSDNVSESVSVSVSDKNRTPAREEFLSFCKSLDIDYESLKETINAKYDTFVADGWCNGYGKPITNWENTIRNVIPHLKPMPKKKIIADAKAKGNWGGGKNAK
jgi:hypothetical protein